MLSVALDQDLFSEVDLDADELAIREGEVDADAGRFIPDAVFEQWLATWGTKEETAPPEPWLK